MISFGSVLNALINFLIIAIAVYFCIVVPINKLRDMSEKAMAKVKGDDSDVAAEEPDLSPEEQTVILLQDIRNALAAQQPTGAHAAPAVTDTAAPESK